MTEVFGDVIHTYTRKQALEDGVLVDVSDMAKEAGFKWPVAITQALHHDIATIPKEYAWEDYKGRLWDVLWMAMLAAKSSRGSTFVYELILHPDEHYQVKAVAGPGDDGEPVVTLMLPEED